jgi:hypothetical protein
LKHNFININVNRARHNEHMVPLEPALGYDSEICSRPELASSSRTRGALRSYPLVIET